MKNFLIILLITLKSIYIFAQKDISKLESKKKEILSKITILNDSLKEINFLINSKKLKEFQKMVSDSTLRGFPQVEGVVWEKPGASGKRVATLDSSDEFIILDYIDGYFKICTDSIFGYISETWIKKDDKIIAFIKSKEAEADELKRQKEENEHLKEVRKIRRRKVELKKKEKMLKNKYGENIYNRLKEGDIFIGMTKEMAIISKGKPDKINRTVNSFGVQEQWVYDDLDLFLYFEDGILTGYQD